MFGKENLIFIQPDDAFAVFAGAYERLLSYRAAEGADREREGESDTAWHDTPALVHEKELLQNPKDIPWNSDGTFELSISPEDLAVGLALAASEDQPAIFDELTPGQKEDVQKYLRELKCLKVVDDSFIWSASPAEQ